MKRILLVDDEVQIIKALVRIFMDTDYEVLTANSGQEALDILKGETIDLIITDMRMPNMDGYELLRQIKIKYPKVMRIILSGYSDEKIIFQALQKNIAKLYILKPWDNEKLLNIINQVCETEDVLNSNNLLTLINNIEQLPTIPDSYERILQLIEIESDMSTIAHEIEKDQAIAAKILHVANSAFYGAKTGSIKQAITYIGAQRTRNLVLSTSVIEGFNNSGVVEQKIEMIWKHSFLTNKILGLLYEKFMCKKLPETAASAGLMHNIGIVLFLDCFKEQYMKMLLEAKRLKQSIMTLEMEEFNVVHTEAAGYLLNWWEFPYPIVEAAMYHHNPLDSKVINKELLCAVHISQGYASQILNDANVDIIDLRTFEILGINRDDFERDIKGLIETI